jgi:voltage-gated potassium channel
VTASLASWLIERVSEEQEESSAVTRADVAALALEVRQLREELRRVGGPGVGTDRSAAAATPAGVTPSPSGRDSSGRSRESC